MRLPMMVATQTPIEMEQPAYKHKVMQRTMANLLVVQLDEHLAQLTPSATTAGPCPSSPEWDDRLLSPDTMSSERMMSST